MEGRTPSDVVAYRDADPATTPDDGEDSGDERIALLSNMADAPGAGVGSGTKTAVAADVALAEAIQNEHNLTFWEAVKLYPAAVGWSVFVSIGVIMLAFDPQLLGNLYATPQFQRDFGYEFNGEYIISAPWQTGLSMGNPVGQVVGALVSAYPMDKFGRKWTFGVCVMLTAGLVFIQFFARSLPVLLVGELLGGLVLGCYVVIAPAYASEVCPLALRGHLTSYTNLCFVMGQLLANGVTAGTSKLDNHWAYSIPFALQWFWILVILPGLAFIPESPWWLVRGGRMAEAENALRRLASSRVDVSATLAVIAETDRLEQEVESGSTYMDCLRGSNLRRTEISVGVYCTQVLSGIYLINYGTYFFQQAGLDSDKAFDMGIGFLAVGFVGTIVSWFLMLRYGRRSIYLYGLSVLVVLQLLIGILDCIPGRPAGVAWAESSLMLVWNFFYDISVGPICFTLIGECSATRVRSKTIAVATAAQGVIGVAMTVAIPYMINPDEVRWSGPLASSPFPGARLTSLLRSLGQHARQTRVFLRRPRGPLLYLGLLPRSRDGRQDLRGTRPPFFQERAGPSVQGLPSRRYGRHRRLSHSCCSNQRRRPFSRWPNWACVGDGMVRGLFVLISVGRHRIERVSTDRLCLVLPSGM